ncbi:sigma factor-like helix-turn-helix DNA-binding protein [Lysinibacillus capsici]|uniref:sigma factor-like helix-turn-helix DNA-binding protein n=1 Tax=Lysinibacillus capsici TaxID=2115968 RepID=UPI0034E41393
MLKGQTVEVKKYMLDQWLKDYHWMIEQIRVGKMQDEVVKTIEYEGAKVANYGIEATLPKASGGTSDPVSYEASRRTQFYVKRVLRYVWKVKEIQERASNVIGEREIFVLHHLFDGYSMRKIAEKMNVSEATVRRIRERILDDMLGKLL